VKYLLCLFAVAATALTACGGSSPPAAAPTPGPTCTPPAGGPSVFALVYPAPSATAVPDQFGQVIVASSPAPLPNSWNVVVTTTLSPSGVAGGNFTIAPTPMPSPTAAPSFPNPSYQSSSFAGLNFPGEVVTVFLNNTASACTPMGPLGQFTTQ
jgi:hypothetical protein